MRTSGVVLLTEMFANLRTGRTLAIDESPTFVETWKEMEKLLETGQTASIE